MYTRFELMRDGEPAGYGFFRGLYELRGSLYEFDQLYLPFDEHLAVPGAELFRGRETRSWFTPAGIERFRADIDAITERYRLDGTFEVSEITSDELGDVIYEDDYQVIQQVA